MPEVPSFMGDLMTRFGISVLMPVMGVAHMGILMLDRLVVMGIGMPKGLVG